MGAAVERAAAFRVAVSSVSALSVANRLRLDSKMNLDHRHKFLISLVPVLIVAAILPLNISLVMGNLLLVQTALAAAIIIALARLAFPPRRWPAVGLSAVTVAVAGYLIWMFERYAACPLTTLGCSY